MLINTNYVAWLADIISDKHADMRVYQHLFHQLMTIPFRWSSGIPLDENRACDGNSLRKKFNRHTGEIAVGDEDAQTSVLEVMVALAMRIEADIMHDSEYGDRTSRWFMLMLISLGISGCVDDAYNASYVDEVIERFLDRQYEPCGRGGLFTTNDPTVNMPTIEIWQQAQIWLVHDIMNK